MLLKNFLLASSILILLSGCGSIPAMPDIYVRVVDMQNNKIHSFLLPKERGKEPEHVFTEELNLQKMDKNITLTPGNYAKLEEYVDALIDWGQSHCK